MLVLELVESIGSRGCESIAPVAQASRDLHDDMHETEACKRLKNLLARTMHHRP